jgi:NAD(P)-dependent dehydrogenase (short-subunit alcohol dehydrogenase family)
MEEMTKKNRFDLTGKISVVTGGAGLIGKEVTRALAEAGASVIVAEINGKAARKAIDSIAYPGFDITFKRLDIKDEKSVVSLIRFADAKYRKIDIWVNCAYPRTRDWGAKFEGVRLSSWRRNIDMHLNGYFICCQKAAEYMKQKGRGSIINFASTYGMAGPDFSIYEGTNMTMPAAYSAIKAGIINFTRYLASYYGRHNIRVNSVSPGGVYNNQPEPFVKRYSKKTLLRRMANPADIAGGVLYLASDAAAYVTGHNLVIDGGWSAV